MTSILRSENSSDINENANSTVINSSLLPKIVQPSLTFNRKRKRAPTHLSRINLNSTSRLCGSNESLNSGISSGSGSDDDCLLTPPFSGEEQPQFPLTSSDEYEKRSRLCTQFSSQSTTSIRNVTSSSSVGTIQYVGILQTSTAIGSNGNNSSNVVDDCYDLAELECSQSGSTSAKSSQQSFASGGLIIGDGEFEIVGDGRECKAVNVRTQVVYHCQVLKADEYKTFLNIMKRINFAEKLYDNDYYVQLKNVLVPDKTRHIRGDNDIWYILLPDHHGNLHSLVQTRYNSFSSSNNQNSTRIFSERRIQPIFKQIVALAEFCHKIGLYFRDFRLRKFVFVDRERTQIRLNNVLDMWVAPKINCDKMTQRHVCPAYVAPEILDIKADAYAGRPADVWALGVLMFILLTGRYPFYEANPNPMALFKRIKTRRFSFPINEYVSHSARWLLHGILRLDPKERPTVTEILRSHWLMAEPESLPDGLKSYQISSKNAISQNNPLPSGNGNNLAVNLHSIFPSPSRHSGFSVADNFLDYFY